MYNSVASPVADYGQRRLWKSKSFSCTVLLFFIIVVQSIMTTKQTHKYSAVHAAAVLHLTLQCEMTKNHVVQVHLRPKHLLLQLFLFHIHSGVKPQ